jgi:hypothetical protein
MKKALPIVSVFALVAVLAAAQKGSQQSIGLSDLRDKIAGGWAGQMIGVSFGAPTEFKYREQIIEGELPEWRPERIRNSLRQDDLYVDMTFAKVLDDKGLDATTADYGQMFAQARYRLWHANLAARRALKRGVKPELTGTPAYNAHANDIDFQIESDFIGLMAPGLPQASNRLCDRAGRVMNYGDGIYGGMFVSGMYAAAFFEKDPRKIVEAGLACIPPSSPYARTIADVLTWSKQHPDDWKKTWKLIEDKWNNREPCPEGALKPFNIDARLNGAYIALGLLYGKGDFDRTLDISTRAGQDSDCNPSNACGILGVVLGYKGIPERWKSGIPAIAKEKFDYTDFNFDSIVESTEKRAIKLVEREGGRLDGSKLIVKVQSPKAPKPELWDDYGSPAERIAAADARWKFEGAWNKHPQHGLISDQKGSSAQVSFEGTGVILVGPYLPDGGRASITLDGKPVATIDNHPDEDQVKNNESLWHAFKLPKGRHELRVQVRGEPYGDSKGARIAITDVVVFR